MPNVNTSVPPSTPSRRRLRRSSIAVASAALLLAACGGSASTEPAVDEPNEVASDEAADAASPAIATPAATIGSTSLGDVLVGERGLTLYGFTNDIDAASVCYGTCAEAWPPVIVPADWTVAPGLDAGIFNATVRDDGQLQLVAGKWPLYYFAGDAAAGDINGQSSGAVWFVVGTDGVLIEDAPPAGEPTDAAPAEPDSPTVTVAATELGEVLVDSDGLTLYGFTDDSEGSPTCNDACADAWPPLTVADGNVPAGLDPTLFSVVTRDDGTNQLKAGEWPLYFFAGDAAPGDVNGQSSGGVWFAVAADGSLVTGADSPIAEPSTDGAIVKQESDSTEPADDGY